MKAKKDTELVLVECVSIFRTRYVVEVPAGETTNALDTVVCNEAKEFSQEHLDEEIVSYRTISKKKALKLCDKDNTYCTTWNDESKIEAFFTMMKK